MIRLSFAVAGPAGMTDVATAVNAERAARGFFGRRRA